MDRVGRAMAQRESAVRAARSSTLERVLRGTGRECDEPRADAFARRAVHSHAVLWAAADEGVVAPPGARREREAGGALDGRDGTGGHL